MAIVAGVVALWRFLPRIADSLAVLPAMATSQERIARKLDAVGADVEEAKGHASAASTRAGSMLGIVTKAREEQKTARGSRYGIDGPPSHRMTLEAEPATAREGAESTGVIKVG